MKLTGTITNIYPTERVGDKYAKLLFIVTNDSGYEGKDAHFPFEVFEKADEGTRIPDFLKYNKEGREVDVEFDIRGRENPNKAGQWFASLSAWKVSKASDSKEELEATETNGDDEVPF